MSGIIDIVVNLYTPQEVELGQTGLDEEFKKQVRMPEKMRSGVTIPEYIKKMEKLFLTQGNYQLQENMLQ